MKQKRTFLLLGVVVAVLSMAVAYAAIQNVDLSVTTNLNLTPDQDNFKVEFTGTPTLTGTGKDTSTVTIDSTDKTKATIDVKGLSAYGDTLLISMWVDNASTDFKARILDSNVTITNSNEEYFDVKYISPTTDSTYEGAPETIILPEGGVMVTHNGAIDPYEFKLEITMKKTPISADETANISVSFIAEPIPNE